MKKGMIASLVLSTALVLSAMPAPVFAASDTASASPMEVTDVYSLNTHAAGLGIDRLKNPEQSNGEWNGNYVYFGMTSRYPIRFRVLDTNSTAYGENAVLLDADLAVFREEYSKNGSTDWANSDLKRYLNEDYLLGNFTEPARNAMVANNGNGLSGEKVFILSQAEANNAAYGYSSKNTRVKKNPKLSQTETAAWYLRDGDGSSVVTIGKDGNEATADADGLSWVSPAVSLKPENVLMTWSADQAKPDSFSVVDAEPTNAQSLTITGGTGFAAQRADQKAVPAGSSFVANVSDLGTSDWGVTYTQISAMLVDDNRNVIAYGPVSDAAATGDLSVTIPSGVPKGNYTVKLFAEDVVSQSINKAVDYASNVVDIPVTVDDLPDVQSETQANPEETATASAAETAAAASATQAASQAQGTAAPKQTAAPVPTPTPVPAAATAHKVSISTDGNGKASVSAASALPGTAIQVSVTPNQGYHVKSWSSKEVSVAADGTFTMPNRDVAIYVVFEKDAPTQYKVNVGVSNGGTVTASKATAAAGDKVQISAKANNGWTFTGWNIPGVATDPAGTYFLMPANDVNVNAVFVQNVTLTLQVSGSGTLTASPTAPTPGQTVVLTPKAYSGYHFKQWVSTDVNPGTSNSFVMPNKNVTVQAVFEKDAPPQPTKYTVTSNVVGSGGSIVLNKGNTYEAGAKVTVDVTCIPGAQCTGLNVDLGGQTKSLDTDGDFFIMPSSNVTVTATFAPLPAPTEYYTVSTRVDGPGQILLPNGTRYEAGDRVQVSVSDPASCVTFFWDAGDGTQHQLNPAGDVFIMPDNDVTVGATFQTAPPPNQNPDPDPDPDDGFGDTQDPLADLFTDGT
ncbi:MAG: hypothetical protein IJJ13_06530 [Lachnospiraceae bacterium]|nr:hypothetical protein [Lachnospiraceae bacterium]